MGVQPSSEMGVQRPKVGSNISNTVASVTVLLLVTASVTFTWSPGILSLVTSGSRPAVVHIMCRGAVPSRQPVDLCLPVRLGSVKLHPRSESSSPLQVKSHGKYEVSREYGFIPDSLVPEEQTKLSVATQTNAYYDEGEIS